MPSSPSSNDRELTLRLPRSALKIAGIAFGAGLLLFVIVWWAGRDDAFYTVPPGEKAAAPAAQADALPAPMSAEGGASGMESPREVADSGDAETPRLVETAPPAPPAPPSIDETAGQTTAAGGSAAPAAGGGTPIPIQGQNPAPRYPNAAMRKRETGTVVVRVQVDAQGDPVGVALIGRSGSRELDRSAMEAVRRWKFQPAQRNGAPAPGSVDIPFEFNLDR
ncbi:energy transducer TonB [Pseudoxanthomonas composti]|uniref:Energy transducer TonB n=1 Tax=Pseudoxanthomonas composti TaxID=2137479 RepID=A0A4Q1JZH6_9GAMM|nr:energy transducer TonB [Pseudoxanthomonas composti]RXR07492.1 energy transducer TonB [Pseudoxanthomonas composti]